MNMILRLINRLGCRERPNLRLQAFGLNSERVKTWLRGYPIARYWRTEMLVEVKFLSDVNTEL